HKLSKVFSSPLPTFVIIKGKQVTSHIQIA
ncbi:MAG: hypothetical protein ACJA0J_000302, partial [Bdellovibrionota bacterium]